MAVDPQQATLCHVEREIVKDALREQSASDQGLGCYQTWLTSITSNSSWAKLSRADDVAEFTTKASYQLRVE
jgi:hypothetical protein